MAESVCPQASKGLISLSLPAAQGNFPLLFPFADGLGKTGSQQVQLWLFVVDLPSPALPDGQGVPKACRIARDLGRALCSLSQRFDSETITPAATLILGTQVL